MLGKQNSTFPSAKPQNTPCASEWFHIVQTASACAVDKSLVDLISPWSTGLAVKAKSQHYGLLHLLDSHLLCFWTSLPTEAGGFTCKALQVPLGSASHTPHWICSLHRCSTLPRLQEHYSSLAQHPWLWLPLVSTLLYLACLVSILSGMENSVLALLVLVHHERATSTRRAA